MESGKTSSESLSSTLKSLLESLRKAEETTTEMRRAQEIYRPLVRRNQK